MKIQVSHYLMTQLRGEGAFEASSCDYIKVVTNDKSGVGWLLQQMYLNIREMCSCCDCAVHFTQIPTSEPRPVSHFVVFSW